MQITLPRTVRLCGKCSSNDNAVYYEGVENSLKLGTVVELGNCEFRRLADTEEYLCPVIKILDTGNEYRDKWLAVQDIDPRIDTEGWKTRFYQWLKSHIAWDTKRTIGLFREDSSRKESAQTVLNEVDTEKQTIEQEIHAVLFERQTSRSSYSLNSEMTRSCSD